ncbi:hypothetical protein FISHEDRAFT_22126, partial [Fistulina hepatica ATCC 64428]
RSPDQIWAEKSKTAFAIAAHFPPADAYSGRSVSVKYGSLGSGVKRLRAILSTNKVVATVRSQVRHEKRGPKRRRIRSEMWRVSFAAHVRQKIQLAQKIKKRHA